MESRQNRSEIVLATKFTARWRDQRDGAKIMTNFTGNSTTSLRHSLDQSLKNLKTDYVDLLYIHFFDHSTSVAELMHALHREVSRGRVDYLGASDCPAWFVAACNEYANARNLTPFVVYQGKWNALERDFEREILPMCRTYGMALAPWGALGQGRFRTPEQLEQRAKEFGKPTRGGGVQSDREKSISLTLDGVAKETGTSIAQVALAYVMSKSPYVFPIVGGTKISYLDDNIAALQLRLTEEQVAKIENAVPFDLGFPSNMIGQDPAQGHDPAGVAALGGPLDYVPAARSIHLK